MFPGILPLYGPSSFFHASDEFFPARRLGNDLHDCDATIGNEAFFVRIDEKVVFILIPCGDLTGLDRGPIEVFAFFGNRKTEGETELIREFFLLFEIAFCLVELSSVEVGNGIDHDVTVQVVSVLVDSDHILVPAKETFGVGSADLKDLFRRYLFVFVEADHVVRVHPAGAFAPEFLFAEPFPVHIIIFDDIAGIRTVDIDIALFDFSFTEHILQNIPHRPVAVSFVINDLIDCHIFSFSFL